MPLPNTFGAASARGFGGFNFQTPRDPNFSSVSLLLPGNGTNGAQNNTFLDSSANNFTITRNGNTTQGTFSPFSQTGWGNYFDGSGDYLSVADSTALDLNTTFTVEGWFYQPTAGNGTIFTRGGGGASWSLVDGHEYIAIVFSGLFYWQFNSGGGNVNISATAPAAGAWHHFAVGYNGTTTRVWLDGASIGTSTSTYSLPSTRNITRAGLLASSTEPFSGYISGLRVVKGTDVYGVGNTSITVPTAPLTAITNTSLLTCQSNRFIDNSTNNLTITPNGDVLVQAFSPFNPTAAWSAAANGGSGYFDGSGDYLSVADSTALDLNTTFTVEGWFYQPTAGDGLIINRGGGNAAWDLSAGHEYYATVLSGNFRWDFNTAGAVTSISTPAPAAGAWHHFAVGYNGTTTRVWLNGASVGTSTNGYSLPTTRNLTRVGYAVSNSTPFTGYISGLRVVKGTDVYGVGNTSITVPTAPLTAITNTSLLLNFTNGAIYDAAAKNDLETVGNAQISTTQSKWGGSSMYFDGTGDWLFGADNTALQLGTGTFTVEGWVYRNASGTYGLVGKGTSTTGWLVSLNASNQVVFTFDTSTITSVGTVAATTWTHIAVVREGTGANQTKIYISGTNDGTGTVSNNFNQTNPIYVGADRTGGSAANAYLQDLRITKGVARYTSNFTPPTAPFPVR